MKILTLNTWQQYGPWRERWELILKGLKVYDADIVGFQEVFDMEWAEEVRRRSGYPYLAASGEPSGLIFLSRYKPIEQDCLVMKTRSPSENCLRYAFYVLFDSGKEKIAVFNTHLSWKAEEQEVRLNQVFELAEFVTRKAGTGLAAVLGDFNTAPDTVPVVFLKDSRKWKDTYAEVNPGTVGFTWDYRNPYAAKEYATMTERRIDYIFITQKIGHFKKILSSRLAFTEPENGIWPSDHFGVLTEFAKD